jgi:hypothetical protein
LLAHIADISDGDDIRRVKAMSFYELSLLGGLALGGVTGSLLWRMLGSGAFGAVAAIYLLAGMIWAFSAVGSAQHGTAGAMSGLAQAARDPALLRLAPAWLSVNAIVGMWLGPTLTFLLTLNDRNGQFLTGLFATQSELVGLVMFGYVAVFATGVSLWSIFLHRIRRKSALSIALVAMVLVCVNLFLLN